jgi:hypothetical protein
MVKVRELGEDERHSFIFENLQLSLPRRSALKENVSLGMLMCDNLSKKLPDEKNCPIVAG